MPDRVFLDTNALVYFISNEKKKKVRAREIIFSSEEVYVSSQIISEFISVCFSKKLLSADEIISIVNQLIEALNFVAVEESTIKKALQIKHKLGFSFWDCLVISSALENNCSILYTEDLQEGQIIENTLTIINPFT